jgi:hypothetical protein
MAQSGVTQVKFRAFFSAGFGFEFRKVHVDVPWLPASFRAGP